MITFEDLNKIAKKYNISSENKELLCFTAIIEELVGKIQKKEFRLFKEFQKKESLIIVDVGCGYFRYGKALYAVFSEINPKIKLFAVDRQKFFKDGYYYPATFIKGDITKIDLKKHGIEKIDIVTVFNPFPSIPDLANIPKAYLFIGCVDWNKKLFEDSLKNNGFKFILWQENFFWQEMRPWWNNYNPFVAGKPIS